MTSWGVQTVVVTVRLPMRLLELVDELVAQDIFANRSEVIRYALYKLLTSDEIKKLTEGRVRGGGEAGE